MALGQPLLLPLVLVALKTVINIKLQEKEHGNTQKPPMFSTGGGSRNFISILTLNTYTGHPVPAKLQSTSVGGAATPAFGSMLRTHGSETAGLQTTSLIIQTGNSA